MRLSVEKEGDRSVTALNAAIRPRNGYLLAMQISVIYWGSIEKVLCSNYCAPSCPCCMLNSSPVFPRVPHNNVFSHVRLHHAWRALRNYAFDLPDIILRVGVLLGGMTLYLHIYDLWQLLSQKRLIYLIGRLTNWHRWVLPTMINDCQCVFLKSLEAHLITFGSPQLLSHLHNPQNWKNRHFDFHVVHKGA